MAELSLTLSAKDLRYFQELKTAEVLQKVDDHRLPQEQGIILICCADGDQMPDIMNWHARIMQSQRSHTRIHTLSSHGGALRVPPFSPLVTPELPRDEVLLSDLREAIELKKIKTVALYVHAPCGVAEKLHLNFLDQLRYLKEAKRRITQEISNLQVACFMHVDNGEKRTYFVSGEHWRNWDAAQHQQPFAAV